MGEYLLFFSSLSNIGFCSINLASLLWLYLRSIVYAIKNEYSESLIPFLRRQNTVKLTSEEQDLFNLLLRVVEEEDLGTTLRSELSL